ncbi:hypothetical protein FNV43_RR09616 [Rhamnella rubrinervis]|uniref:Endonuclease/exonuclease/phosphatase domain-containing protein n=1 Tax=Rhamnella rubrinervis TaxID=2594499 RepID=A0A8K0HAR6_9ROSA|nr:hypothetical protein FNV43_RR09616 [Rhamnella rubrinervis]
MDVNRFRFRAEWARGFSEGRGGGPTHAPPPSMKILLWNCRGLGRKEARLALFDLVKKWRPNDVFLSETKGTFSKLEKLCRRLKFEKFEVVDSTGQADDSPWMLIGDLNEVVECFDKLGGRELNRVGVVYKEFLPKYKRVDLTAMGGLLGK